MTHNATGINASQALEKLKAGNALFVAGDYDQGDVSRAVRAHSVEHGQVPYAIVVTCSDSRIVPDVVFSAGIGDLFVIRVAGNVIDDHQLGSIEYACGHLDTKLVVVMGHDHCGAVEAALHEDEHDDPEGFIGFIVEEIKKAIGRETDPLQASRLNVEYAVGLINKALVNEQNIPDDVRVVGALYYLATGEVVFL